MRIYSGQLFRPLTVLVFMLWCVPMAEGALIFNFAVPDPGRAPSAEALAGFNDAANLWSGILTDNVTINIDLYWEPLGAGIIGSASSTKAGFSYSNVRTALTGDVNSADDTTAVSNMSGSSFDIYMNRTQNNPNGANSATGYVDSDLTDIDVDGHANNSWIRMTTANAKSMGLIAGNAPATDVSITFSSAFAFDFDRTDGINGAKMDFIGVAAHEIGHGLGFTSGVDILDLNGSGFFDDQFDYVSTLDLFRYSPESVDLGGVGTIDWSASGSAKYLSLDGGQNKVTGVSFSTGKTYGDGQQASHWKDNLGLGLLDPTTGYGERIDPINNDKRAMDVIGWDLVAGLPGVTVEAMGAGGGGAAPEPGMLVAPALVTLGMYLTGRRRRGWDVGVK